MFFFLIPKAFVIWDSKIYLDLYEDSNLCKYEVEDIDKYNAYLNFKKNKIAESTKFLPIIKNIQPLYSYEISKFRVIEWMFFRQENNETN